jgi:hypothetical protein
MLPDRDYQFADVEISGNRKYHGPQWREVIYAGVTCLFMVVMFILACAL